MRFGRRFAKAAFARSRRSGTSKRAHVPTGTRLHTVHNERCDGGGNFYPAIRFWYGAPTREQRFKG
jgi:hypothetical protein